MLRLALKFPDASKLPPLLAQYISTTSIVAMQNLMKSAFFTTNTKPKRHQTRISILRVKFYHRYLAVVHFQ